MYETKQKSYITKVTQTIHVNTRSFYFCLYQIKINNLFKKKLLVNAGCLTNINVKTLIIESDNDVITLHAFSEKEVFLKINISRVNS